MMLSYLGPIEAAKYSAKAEDKYAPDPAKWQHLRQCCPVSYWISPRGLLIGLGDQLAKPSPSWGYMLDEAQDKIVWAARITFLIIMDGTLTNVVPPQLVGCGPNILVLFGAYYLSSSLQCDVSFIYVMQTFTDSVQSVSTQLFTPTCLQDMCRALDLLYMYKAMTADATEHPTMAQRARLVQSQGFMNIQGRIDSPAHDPALSFRGIL